MFHSRCQARNILYRRGLSTLTFHDGSLGTPRELHNIDPSCWEPSGNVTIIRKRSILEKFEKDLLTRVSLLPFQCRDSKIGSMYRVCCLCTAQRRPRNIGNGWTEAGVEFTSYRDPFTLLQHEVSIWHHMHVSHARFRLGWLIYTRIVSEPVSPFCVAELFWHVLLSETSEVFEAWVKTRRSGLGLRQ